MRIRNLAAFMAAMSIMLSCTLSVSGTSLGRTVNITVDTGKDRKAISPYIYGVNAELMEMTFPVRRCVRAATATALTTGKRTLQMQELTGKTSPTDIFNRMFRRI